MAKRERKEERLVGDRMLPEEWGGCRPSHFSALEKGREKEKDALCQDTARLVPQSNPRGLPGVEE